ncbi:MAG: hypothetical protein Fur0032_23100 [Terrimicrobiaceae bacterium]
MLIQYGSPSKNMTVSRQNHLRQVPGLTLVEILVVVAVLGVLAALLMPVIGGMRDRAMRSEALSNLRQIHAAFCSFSSDSNMELPIGYQESNASLNRPFVYWQAQLVQKGYLGEPDKPAKSEKQPIETRYSVLGSPRQRRNHPTLLDQGRYNTFSGNWGVLLGNFGNNPDRQRPRTVNFERPSKTLLVSEGSTHSKPNANFNPMIYGGNPRTYPNYVTKALTPEANDKVACLFVDGHVEELAYSEFPLQTTPTKSDAWYFWVGRE